MDLVAVRDEIAIEANRLNHERPAAELQKNGVGPFARSAISAGHLVHERRIGNYQNPGTKR